MELETLLRSIPSPSPAAAEAARERWNSLAKPLGSLGRLEDAVIHISALTANPDVHLDERALLVFCADNGVVARGVSQCGSEVTASVARALAAGESTVSYMAKSAGCAVYPADVGILDFPPVPGIISCRVRNGTADISAGPAMTRAECIRAVLAGA